MMNLPFGCRKGLEPLTVGRTPRREEDWIPRRARTGSSKARFTNGGSAATFVFRDITVTSVGQREGLGSALSGLETGMGALSLLRVDEAADREASRNGSRLLLGRAPYEQ